MRKQIKEIKFTFSVPFSQVYHRAFSNRKTPHERKQNRRRRREMLGDHHNKLPTPMCKHIQYNGIFWYITLKEIK